MERAVALKATLTKWDFLVSLFDSLASLYVYVRMNTSTKGVVISIITAEDRHIRTCRKYFSTFNMSCNSPEHFHSLCHNQIDPIDQFDEWMTCTATALNTMVNYFSKTNKTMQQWLATFYMDWLGFILSFFCSRPFRRFYYFSFNDRDGWLRRKRNIRRT